MVVRDITRIKHNIQIFALLALCLCMPALTCISLNFEAGTQGEAPRSARTVSSFIANPSDTPELVNETRFKSLRNGEFNHYSTANEHYDVFDRYTGDVGSNSTATQDNSRYIEGSNSLLLRARRYSNASGSIQISQTYPSNEGADTDPNNYVITNTTLGFNFFIETNDHDQDGNDSFFVQLTLNASTTQYLCYYISGYAANTSSIRNLNVTDHNQKDVWYFFSTNVTQDYLNSGLSGTIEDLRITAVDLYMGQILERSTPIVGSLDNFTLAFGEILRERNGGFETLTGVTQTIDNWTYLNHSPGAVTHSSFSASGGTSLNLTTSVTPAAVLTPSESHATLYQDVSSYGNSMEISGNHTADIALRYYISALPVLNTGSARISMTFWNGSVLGMLNIFFFNNRPDLISNSSTMLSFFLPVNTTGNWWSFQAPLLAFLNLLYPWSTWSTIFLLRSVGYYINSNGTTTASNSLLLEDAGLQWTSFFDPEFEHVKTSGSGIRGYVTIGGLLANYSTNTSGSPGNQYSGNFTNNVGVPASGTFLAAEQGLWEEITTETTVSFDYNLDTFSGTSWTDFAMVAFLLQSWNSAPVEQLNIGYMLATGLDMPANTSDTVFYPTDNINQTMTWLTVKRNLYRDFEAYFTTRNAEDYFMEAFLVLPSSNDVLEPVVLLIDNLKFGTGMPVGEGNSYLPVPAVYSADLTLTLDAFDSGSGISSARVYYDTGSGAGWQSLPMAVVDADEQTFNVTIPKAQLHYGLTFKFYFQLTDNAHNTNTYPLYAPSTSISVVIDDVVPPVIASIALNPTVGRANLHAAIRAQVTDAGSGVQTVTAYYSSDGGAQWQNVVLSPIGNDLYEGSAGSYPENTVLMVYVTAIDKEGNSIGSNAGGIYNYFTIGPTLTIWEMFGIGAAASAAIIGIVVIRRKRAKGRKLSAGNLAMSKPTPPPVTGPKTGEQPPAPK